MAAVKGRSSIMGAAESRPCLRVGCGRQHAGLYSPTTPMPQMATLYPDMIYRRRLYQGAEFG
jgi:hypothetical protein